MPTRVRASDDDEESQLLNKKGKLHGQANYDLLRLRDMERFIFKTKSKSSDSINRK